MILKDSFYTIQRRHTDSELPAYDIRLNPDHYIYQAHFPGEPVTPGVCLLQIARELLEDYLQATLEIRSVKNMKFLAIVSPEETPEVTARFDKISQDAGTVTAQFTVCTPERDFVKLSFSLTVA